MGLQRCFEVTVGLEARGSGQGSKQTWVPGAIQLKGQKSERMGEPQALGLKGFSWRKEGAAAFPTGAATSQSPQGLQWLIRALCGDTVR